MEKTGDAGFRLRALDIANHRPKFFYGRSDNESVWGRKQENMHVLVFGVRSVLVSLPAIFVKGSL